MSTLERAIEIATGAHEGQVDKHGLPYILHPLRVMLAQSSREAQIVGVLHDVVEDNDWWSLPKLSMEGFSERVVASIDRLTRRADEEYSAYIVRAGSFAVSRAVKIADLRDNLSPDRPCPPSLRPRYEKALAKLLELC